MSEAKITLCLLCGRPITYEDVILWDKVMHGFKPKHCDPCIAKHNKEEDRKKGAAIWEAHRKFLPFRWDKALGNKEAPTAITKEGITDTKTWEPNGRNLWIGGVSGAGKTTGVCAVLEQMARAGRRWKYEHCPRMMLSYSDSFGKGGGMSFVNNIAKFRGLLVLDDLGVGKLTDRGREALYCIFDERLARRLTTWVTANLKMTEDSLDAWIADEAYAHRIGRRCREMFVEVIVNRPKGHK